MSDDIGLNEDIEPSEEATEDVKGGAAMPLEMNQPAAGLNATPTKAGAAGLGSSPVTKLQQS